MDTVYILTLLATPKVGRKTVAAVLSTAKEEPANVKDLGDILLAAKANYPRIQVPTKEALARAYQDAMAILEQAEQLGIEVVGAHSSRFPRRLRTIPDPPAILYAKGNLDCLAAEPSVAVVGTREPTPFGAKMAERFGTVFAEAGLVVVSGLALGCDAAAHRGCLNAGGHTIAVLAHGLDMVYPATNRELAAQILDSGCLVSEYPPGQKPHNSLFVDRDRIQSGLSAAVVVVETDIKGGTMHTARFCVEQGRYLACLVHPPEFASYPQAQGNQQLIAADKAIPLSNRADLDAFIARLTAPAVEPSTPPPGTTASANVQLSFLGLDEV